MVDYKSSRADFTSMAAGLRQKHSSDQITQLYVLCYNITYLQCNL